MVSPLLTTSYNEHHVFVRWSTKYKKAMMALVTSVRRRRDEVPRVSPHYETESLPTSCREVPSSNGEREPRKWIWPKSFFFHEYANTILSFFFYDRLSATVFDYRISNLDTCVLWLQSTYSICSGFPFFSFFLGLSSIIVHLSHLCCTFSKYHILHYLSVKRAL